MSLKDFNMSERPVAKVFTLRLSSELKSAIQVVTDTLKGMEVCYPNSQGGTINGHISSQNELIERFVYLGLIDLEKDIIKRLDEAKRDYEEWCSVLAVISPKNSDDKIVDDDWLDRNIRLPMVVTGMFRQEVLDKIADLHDVIGRLTKAKIGLWKTMHGGDRVSAYSEQQALPKVEESETWHLMSYIGPERQQPAKS